MKLIDTKTHGYLDYIMGIFLIVSPFLFNLDTNAIQSFVFYGSGSAVIIYSLHTNYELGLFKMIPMKIHLAVDIVSGLFLAASPWLYHFSDVNYLPHLTIGMLEIAAALLTISQPRTEMATYSYPKI
jgi:hypothetical protein